MDSTIYKKIEAHLMDIIQQHIDIPDYQLPSERMLSAHFNASRKPVRRAYDNLISKGYVTNIHGKGYFILNNMNHTPAALSDSSPKVSLIMPSIQSQYSHDILAGVSDFCSKHQLELSINLSDSSAEKEAYLIRSLPAAGAKGLILFPVNQNRTYHNELLKLSLRRYPIALIDREVPNIHASFISSDNHQAMVDAVEFLHSKGLEHLVYISPPSTQASTVEARINGFTHGLLRHYKMAKPQNILIVEHTPTQLKETVIRHLQAHPETQIIFCLSHHLKPVLRAIQELGLHIPRDLKLMLFDHEISSLEINEYQPFILKQDGYGIGYYAAQSLYNQIYGDLRPVTKMLPVTIIDTTAETHAVT